MAREIETEETIVSWKIASNKHTDVDRDKMLDFLLDCAAYSVQRKFIQIDPSGSGNS